MNTKIIIGALVAVVVVGGGAWYLVSHNASTTAPGQTATPAAPATAETQPQSGTGTIAALWGMTGSLQCDVSSNNASAPFSGKVYVSGGKVRADVSATIASMGNKQVESHMIRSDGFIYSWTNLIPQGVKIPETQATTGSSQSQGVSASTQVSYTCLPWISDDMKFVVPTSVSFMTPPSH